MPVHSIILCDYTIRKNFILRTMEMAFLQKNSTTTHSIIFIKFILNSFNHIFKIIIKIY